MKDIISFQMDWMVQSSEILADYVKKGTDTVITDIRVLRIKNDTYRAILTLWNQLMVIDRRISDSESVKSDLEKALGNFRADIADVYALMETDKDYYLRGGWESFFDLWVKEFHRLIANYSGKMKDVQKELDKFWSEFFKIKKQANEQEPAYAQMMNEFENRIKEVFQEKKEAVSKEEKNK